MLLVDPLPRLSPRGDRDGANSSTGTSGKSELDISGLHSVPVTESLSPALQYERNALCHDDSDPRVLLPVPCSHLHAVSKVNNAVALRVSGKCSTTAPICLRASCPAPLTSTRNTED
jgi:hypothetical protein